VGALQGYFDDAGVNAGVGRIDSVEQIAGGYSKDTWRVRASVGIRGNQRLILRRDLPFGPGENTVTEELELLRALHAAGLPVPEPLWHERDRSPVGKPFLLFPELPGRAVFGDWHADKGEQHKILCQLAQVMAKLHALPAQELPFLSGGVSLTSPQELVRQYVQSWYDKWLHRQVAPSAIMETAYRWLLDHVPADLAAPSIVHGDISLRNTLLDNGRLVALLDWEFWHLGDPVEDLSYFRLVAEPYIAWDDFMQAYQQAGGVEYDEERAAYYAVWRSVRNATTTTTAWNGFLSGAYPVSKAAYQGISLYRFFLNDIATQLQSRGL
jgi:aminoglycoside phosphotransferase (APT) family kinase protein